MVTGQLAQPVPAEQAAAGVAALPSKRTTQQPPCLPRSLALPLLLSLLLLPLLLVVAAGGGECQQLPLPS